jgi:hypothetical protein
MVEYLESLCVGELLTGSKGEVSEKLSEASKKPEYKDLTCTLPDPPPTSSCSTRCKGCTCCKGEASSSWWMRFRNTVDDLLLRSNIHKHKVDKQGNDKSYCLNSKGECKRHFPRDTFEQTMMDPNTGALNLKKGEPWMNTVTPVLTYLLRANSDVTSLLSGTAIKAVMAYVTDYITKQSLKTYSIFDVVRSIFDKNSEIIGGDTTCKEKVRKIFTQVVNSLTAKMEIGSPMASLYMLGNPDHYTSHKFVPFYWKSYVKEAMNAWTDEGEGGQIESLGDVKENVIINKSNGNFIGLSKVDDYICRPTIYKSTCLYDWIRFATKKPKRRMKAKKAGDPIDDPDFDESDDELDIIPRPKVADIVEPENITEFKVPLSNIDEDISEQQELFAFDENAVDSEEEAELDELDIMDEVAESVPKKKDYSLQPNHPQHQTHQVRMQKEDPSVVPNFLPNTLPRSNRGD